MEMWSVVIAVLQLLLIAYCSVDVGAATAINCFDFSAHTDWDRVLDQIEAVTKEELANADAYGTCLHHAIQWSAPLPIIEKLLDKGLDINQSNFVGLTPLISAVQGINRINSPSLPVVELLLTRGAAVNKKGVSGGTALFFAISQQNDLQIAKLLLKFGADVDIPRDTGATPLHQAVRRGQYSFKAVQLLLKHHAFIDAIDDADRTPLLLAVTAWADPNVIKVLLEAGANVNLADNKGWTPLWAADNFDIISMLIKYGADVNRADDIDGITPLMRAFFNEVVDERIVNLLIKSGANVNQVDKKNSTPLMHAVWSNKTPDLVTKLLIAGADVTVTNDNGETALHIAASRPNPLILWMLLHSEGVEVNQETNDGRTPLQLAMNQLDPVVITSLLDSGADPNHGPPEVWPLFEAVRSRANSDIIEMLLSHGADVKARLHNSHTILFIAMHNQVETKVIKLLCKFGADLNARDMQENSSPLIIAVRRQLPLATITTLLEAGADPALNDNMGKTALDYAKELPGDNDVLIKVLQGNGTPIIDADSLIAQYLKPLLAFLA